MKSPHTKPVYIYGINPLMEALTARPECIERVLLSPEIRDQKLIDLIRKKGISMNELRPRDVEKMFYDDVPHQGVVAVVNPEALLTDLSSVLKDLDMSTNPCVVLLDELQDPQNVGAIIRSAAAFGASAILMPEHNQAPITGTVVKASAGMAFRIPLVQIGNVNNTIRDLKEAGFWAYGLAMEGKNPLHTEVFDAPALFVIGSEGAGIRQKTLETCDIVLQIPMDPRCESLNAATAAGITLYQWYAGKVSA